MEYKMEIDSLLKSWEVSQDTIQVFRENNIDVSCLNGLGEEELNILIPPNKLRDDQEAVHSETYYVPSRTLGPKNTMPAKHKLVDNENETTENDTDGEIIMQWLKYNRDPWPFVETNWKASCAYYRKTTSHKSNKTLEMMVTDWPCLNTPNWHRLIEMDFEYAHPKKSSKLFEKWDTFQTICMAHLMEADSAIPNNLQEHFKEDNINEKVRDLAMFRVLAYIIKPTSKFMDVNKKKYKVSIAESSQSFLSQVKNYADIEEELEKRKKAHDKKRLTCEPIIISVGEVFYVCIDHIKNSFDSVTKAIDVYFKCFIVLNFWNASNSSNSCMVVYPTILLRNATKPLICALLN